MKRVLPYLVAVTLALGGFGLGRITAGPTLPVVPLPSGGITPDPSDGPSAAPSDTPQDRSLVVDITPEGTLAAAGASWTETTGTLLLTVHNRYDGYLVFAIERDRGNGQFEVAYEVVFEQAASGEVPLEVGQAGSYRVSVIPGNPPLEASTATLTIVDSPTP
jgi:hypothetical protein